MGELKSVRLDSYDNSWYSPNAGIVRCLMWYLVNVLFIRNYLNPFSGIKVWLLRMFGAKLGKSVTIKPGVNVKYPWMLEVGDNVWIGESVWIDNLCPVIIGSNVCISQGAMLLTGNHNYKKVTFDLIVGKIILEDGVWIGAQATVCPGTVCGSHSVLTVGSIAIGNMEPYSIYKGNPAVKVKIRVIE